MVASLVDLIYTPGSENWSERNQQVFQGLFEARYPKAAQSAVRLRANDRNDVMFAAYIHASNTDAGRYAGISFFVFPVDDQPALFGLCIGTAGLTPDDHIVTRPGHARKCGAIARWLNRLTRDPGCAWAKTDPANSDPELFPTDLYRHWSAYRKPLDRYRGESYLMIRPTQDREITRQAIIAVLDLYFAERGFEPRSREVEESEKIQSEYLASLTPVANLSSVRPYLEERRFVILSGPPGTGKTRLSQQIVAEDYPGRSKVIQFHPGTNYEDFVGGLAPDYRSSVNGLQFRPKAGFLMEAVRRARQCSPDPYLLVIDEINRADLSKTLGEAIYLVEADAHLDHTHEVRPVRQVELTHDFGEPWGSRLELPDNLRILGTMNSADRSIASLDLAIRRRFAFVTMWPRMDVVRECGGELAQSAFRRLFEIFVEYAREDQFLYVPGHSYFLDSNDQRMARRFEVALVPLLNDYLQQGYAAGFSEQLRAYLTWLDVQIRNHSPAR